MGTGSRKDGKGKMLFKEMAYSANAKEIPLLNHSNAINELLEEHPVVRTMVSSMEKRSGTCLAREKRKKQS